MANRADNFNRGNGVLNGSTPSDGGSAWTAVNYSVNTNRIECTALGYAYEYAYLEASSSVGEASVTLAVKGQSIGPALRMGDGNSYFVLFVVGNQLQLYKRINSTTISQIGSTYSGTISAGDVIKLGVDSSNQFTGYQNGTARVGPVTDSFNSTATKVGFVGYSNSAAARLDDFSFTDLAGGGADFTFSGSGGIQFSGAATAQSTAAFSVSGSGGLQFAGAATNTFTNAFSVSGSGGLSFGGTASGVYTTAWAASGSGGLQFGGAAGASSGSDYAVTGAGGITFAGAAAALNSADFSMSATGGLLFAGAAAAQVDAGFAATGSGGLLFGGAAGAVTSPTFAFSGGGGLLLGGDAAQACTTVYSFTASGGMLLAGAATASMSTGGGTGATVDDIWNGILLEASLSPADMLRIILAAVSGKTTGIGTDSEQYLSVDGSKARVAATFDGNGNRQAVTLDGSA